MADILRAMDAADKPVAECPPEMGQMDQGGSINIQMNDTNQMAQLLQALQAVQSGVQGEDVADEVEVEDYDNEPEEEYMDVDAVLPSGDDLHKKKTMYPPAAGGDNPMAMESIKDRLWAALNEKKKPDADGDGVPDWADKKPGEDDNAGKKKGSKPKKGVVPPQFKKTTEGRGKGKLMAGRGRGKNVKAAEGRGRGKARGRGKG